MKGWPNRRRLLWGRSSLLKGLALPAALLLVITVAAGFYFVIPLFSGFQNHIHEVASCASGSVQDKGVQNHLEPNQRTSNLTSYRDVLKIASVKPALSALINTSSSSGQLVTYAELVNSGQDTLRQVKIADEGGKLIGVLSQLSPGERKTLALSGKVEKANVTATDSSGGLVVATIRYEKPALSSTAGSFGIVSGGGSSTSENSNPEPVVTPGPVTGEGSSETKAASAASHPTNTSQRNASQVNSQKMNDSQTNNSQTNLTEIASTKTYLNTSDDISRNNNTQEPRSEPRFNLTIRTNQSEGREGDSISYECAALITGKEDLSNLEMVCGDKRTSTTYLTPGKEIHINGFFTIEDNTLLNATVKGNDTQGNVWKANATAWVWMLSPDLMVRARVLPDGVHRGDQISMSVDVENAGKSRLHNITVSDSSGLIGQINILDPGKSASLHENRTARESLLDQIAATANQPGGQKVYGSARVQIKVFGSGLNLTAVPNEAVVYPGLPVDATWVLNNTGEEILKNITLTGTDSKYRLKEIAPGTSVRMSTIYVLNKSSRINVTAKGYDSRGYAVQDGGSIHIRVISPGISLKVTPSDVEAFVGEDVNLTCLVTNTGDDDLTNVVLSENGDVLDRIEGLSPGEFHVFSPNAKIASNSTLDFSVQGTDSLGRTLSDSSKARASLVTSSVKISVIAPESVKSGDVARITCTLDNPGSVPLYNILANSKTFGPLGLIDYLAPKQQKTLTADEPVNEEVKDVIKAEGVTSAKLPVTDSCHLHIAVVGQSAPASASGQQKPAVDKEAGSALESKTAVVQNSRAGTNSGAIAWKPIPSEKKGSELNLKAQQATSEAVANPSSKKSISEKGSVQVADISSAKNGNDIVDEISGLVQYIKKMLDRMGRRTEVVSRVENPSATESGNEIRASKNYELAIESAKGSDHGRIKVMDVSAAPPNPSAGTPVKITTHVQSETGIESASVKFGVKDTPITKMQMPSVNRIYTIPMTLESGDSKNGYWSCSLPGRAAGTYMVLSVALKDETGAADDGPYMLHWSTVTQQDSTSSVVTGQASSDRGKLYIESSVVRGTGEVSVKDDFNDNAMGYKGWMKGNGSITMESQRSIDKNRPMVNFTQRSDLVFEGGQLQGEKSLESPAFYGGIGASVTERFNLSHVDKSETDMIRSINSSDNTLAFNTDQAFNGTWNIKTQYAQMFKKMKGDQQYSGSFQTQKNIKFQDLGKN
jgi:hypothetical protein